MSAGITKCSKIRHIVKLRQFLRRWRNKARTSSAAANRPIPSDVPAGHVAICVGAYCTRYVVPASYLNHPVFKKLLLQAEEEYGFANNHGPLAIPCDESLFEEVMRSISQSAASQRYCHVDVKRSNLDFLADSRPLLRGFSDKTIW